MHIPIGKYSIVFNIAIWLTYKKSTSSYMYIHHRNTYLQESKLLQKQSGYTYSA